MNRRPPALGAALAVLAALPSLLWAAGRPDLMTDDFTVAMTLRDAGLVGGTLDLSLRAPGRPTVGAVYVLVYEALGDRPVALALLMAALNAVAAVAVWRALCHVARPSTAYVAALVFAVVPNRASTRFWPVLAPNLVAVTLVAAGVVVLVAWGRLWLAAVFFTVAVGAYEAVAPVALVATAWWWWRDRWNRTAQAALVAGPVVAMAAAVFALSPKRDQPLRPFSSLDTVGAAQAGVGFWGSEALHLPGAVLFFGAIVWATASHLPSFRPADPRPRSEVLAGAVLAAAGLVSFVAAGAPLGVSGVFDRNNLVPDVGTALVVAGALSGLGGLGSVGRRAATPMAAAALAALAAANLADLRAWTAAADEGRRLVGALRQDVDPAAGTTVVVPPLSGRDGTAQFILDGDLTAALRLRHGDAWSSVSLPHRRASCRRPLEEALAAGRPAAVYDRRTRTTEPVTDPVAACRGRDLV